MTREEILNQTYFEFITPLCQNAGGNISEKVKISVGIPKGSEKVIGQCWGTEAGSGYFHIFISPKINDFCEAVEILIHEAIHTLYMNHRKGFQKLAANVGLKAPQNWGATVADEQLKEMIKTYSLQHNFKTLYHQPALVPIKKEKKQTTRMYKMECANSECGYIARASREHLKKGLPTCVCGSHFTTDYEPEVEEEENEND